jgi:hypothetical protein
MRTASSLLSRSPADSSMCSMRFTRLPARVCTRRHQRRQLRVEREVVGDASALMPGLQAQGPALFEAYLDSLVARIEARRAQP